MPAFAGMTFFIALSAIMTQSPFIKGVGGILYSGTKVNGEKSCFTVNP